MKKTVIILLLAIGTIGSTAKNIISYSKSNTCVTLSTDDAGTLTIKPLTDNTVRVTFSKKAFRMMPEWIYVNKSKTPKFTVKEENGEIAVSLRHLTVKINRATSQIKYFNERSVQILAETNRSLTESLIGQEKTYIAEQKFLSPSDEHLFGLGQFQDGYLDVRGLSRRLTQVNTQISVPFILSNKGYGLLWNNYGMTEFNPSTHQLSFTRDTLAKGATETVDVTTTNGNRREIRHSNKYSATLNILQDGQYSFLLDVGQKMARRLNLSIDGRKVIDMQNLWLPPTGSAIVKLNKGQHAVSAELSGGDSPKLFYDLITDQTVFRSPVSESVDYTVFAGNADEAISAYRKVTGEVPMMPRWAMGYIHCRERFNTQQEILDIANKFRNDSIPVDALVQDWQYWGKYGWNAMRFDEDRYPNAKSMTDSLHKLNLHLMVSVWSNTEHSTEWGKQMDKDGYFIPQTNWIDFFNPKAAEAYWSNFSTRMLPYGIDAWWQDATEPENDDLSGRMVNNGTTPGEVFRNTYPLLVNKTVYEGCRRETPSQRTMILSRCAFPGIQRYCVANWSGDVGNDWDTFRRQIIAGLGMMSSGLPWWTYDAGGFFRPGNSQYTDTLYHERMLRWVQTSVFLPLMRVHGYQSNTEFWNYGTDVMNKAQQSLKLRYRLLSFIYSEAARISLNGGTMMRPLIMDFPADTAALAQKCEYMFGPSLLVSPITSSHPQTWSVYLPETDGGWYDFWNGERYHAGYSSVPVSSDHIPTFVRAGSVLVLNNPLQSTKSVNDESLEVRIYKGSNGKYALYQDEGDGYNYEQGKYSIIKFEWDDKSGTLHILNREGEYKGMPKSIKMNLIIVNKNEGCGIHKYEGRQITYTGKSLKIKL